MGIGKRRKKVVEEAANPITPPTVRIIGAGGVGFWTVVGLVRSGVRPLVVYDTDNLVGGLGHMRLPAAVPTTPKVQLLRGFIAMNFPGSRVGELTFRAERFDGTETVAGDLVVDCSDMSGTARRAIYSEVQKRGGRYLRVSYDGAAGIVAVSQGMPLTGDEDHAGYDAVPTLALSLMAGGIAAEVVAKTAWTASTFVEFQVVLAELAGYPVVEARVAEQAA